MTQSKDIKKYTQYRILRQLAARIHNPQVIQAYANRLDRDDKENSTSLFLRQNLIVKPKDNFSEIILKSLIFYLMCGRLNVGFVVPMMWTSKADKFKPQLAISFRPVKRRKIKYGKYDPNTELHIPHYNLAVPLSIPSYTVGMQTAKYTLTDQTYILVNALTEEEAIKVVAKLAEYTQKSKRPKGTILENITTTRRRGKVLDLDNQKIVPFYAAYYEGGKGGMAPTFTTNL
jgi:hypothetical protein